MGLLVFNAQYLFSADSKPFEIEAVEFKTEQRMGSLKSFRWNSFWSDWKQGEFGEFSFSTTLHVNENLSESLQSYHLLAYLPGTYDVFLDGNQIGKNGNTQETAQGLLEQEPGRGRSVFSIPSYLLTPGIHELTIKGTRVPHRFAIDSSSVKILRLEALLAREQRATIVYGSYLIYFILGLYFVSNFLIKRQNLSHLYIGIICFLFSTYALNKIAYHHFGLSYMAAGSILQIVYSINYVICFFAHLAVFESLGFKKKWQYFTLPIPILFAYFAVNLSSFGSLKTTFQWLLLVSVVSLFLRRTHALKACIITGSLTAVYTLHLFNLQQFATYSAIMLYVLFSVGLAFFKQHKEKQESELTNARLNLELIKNKIQPHFVLNSITSAMEWIESDPKQGVAFLNALAKEFELLSRISEQKLIPLSTEIDSCRSYLKVMEFRKKASYQLSLVDVTLQNTLPPSIIRNLLENAITHNSFGRKSVEFTLTEYSSRKGRIYEFRSPLKHPQKFNDESRVDGTGIQYIKARLTESYRNKWNYSHGAVIDEWVTRIEVLN